MARVRPFAAVRYLRPEVDITPVTAPPYDVISPDQRAALLAQDAHNVVALELPDGPLDPAVLGNRYETGAATWRAWREAGVLGADVEPAVYVLEQRFEQGGMPVRRRAFIVEVGLEPFDAGIVLPHERTLPKALGDRFELTKSTAANLSQVLSLYDDAAGETDEIFEVVTAGEPIATATDSDGVLSVVWASTDPAVAARLADVMAEKPVFIADGHHRYTTALAYRDLRREQAAAAGEHPVDPAYDFVMMALVNMEDPQLVVLPTHRVADVDGDFDAASFYAALDEHFIVEDLPAGHPSAALEGYDRPAFLVRTRDDERPRRVVLRPDTDLDTVIPLDKSSAWKHLDVAVLQELVLDPLFDIHPDRPATLERLTFVKNAHDALGMAEDHDAVFILRPTRMDQLRQVATSGETMPQKSTYFFPKLLSGLLFRDAE